MAAAKTNSLERVLAILDLFSEQHLEWTPEELMSELGYSRPTLYRYLKGLKESGLLMPTRNGSFTLGPRVVEMDFLSRRADPLMIAAKPELARLTAAHPCTALIVRWYGNKMLCVASRSSAPNPASSYPRGRPMPLGRGAIARSIMAFLPKPQQLPLITRNLQDLRAVGLGSSPAEIRECLKQVRRAGFAVAHGEVTPGAVGIAAPVLDDGYPVASLCVTIAGSSVTGAQIDKIAAEVRGSAQAIAAANDVELRDKSRIMRF